MLFRSDHQHGPYDKAIGEEPNTAGNTPHDYHRKQNAKNSRCDNRSHSIIQSFKREHQQSTISFYYLPNSEFIRDTAVITANSHKNVTGRCFYTQAPLPSWKKSHTVFFLNLQTGIWGYECSFTYCKNSGVLDQYLIPQFSKFHSSM